MIYKGLKAIARRMGWHNEMTPIRYHDRPDLMSAFPMYQLPGRGKQFVWVTSDRLITLWEKRMSRRSWESRRARLRLPRCPRHGVRHGMRRAGWLRVPMECEPHKSSHSTDLLQPNTGSAVPLHESAAHTVPLAPASLRSACSLRYVV